MRSVILIVLLAIHFLLIEAIDLQRPLPKGIPAKNGKNEKIIELRMPGAHPTMKGELMCTGFTLDNIGQQWITQFKAYGDAHVCHHIGIYSCRYVPDANRSCGCPMEDRTLVYSWVKNTPPSRLPPSTGFKIGNNSVVKYLFLEVHYHGPFEPGHPGDFSGVDIHLTSDKQKYAVGHLSPMAVGSIPPLQKKFRMKSCVEITWKTPLHVIAYQPHAHALGRLVVAYKISGKTAGEIMEIGRGNPHWPQAYIPLPRLLHLEYGDTLFVRCIFDSSDKNTTTNTVRLSEPSEMCIFHMLYYTDPDFDTNDNYKYGDCTDDQYIPADGEDLLPPNPVLQEHASHGNRTGKVYFTDKLFINLDFEDFMSVEGIIGAANSAWWDVSRYSFSVKLALMALIVFVIAFVVSSSLKMIMKNYLPIALVVRRIKRAFAESRENENKPSEVGPKGRATP